MALAKDYLEPLSGPARRKKFAVFDIESKHEDTQRAGFTTPFLLGFYDPLGHGYEEWRNEPHLKTRSWKERYYLPGGVIDKFMNYFLVPRFKGYVCYAHNGGSFDNLFLLAWLRLHRDEFDFLVIPVQSSIQKILVWRKPDEPDGPIRLKWEFLDSMKLLPMGLERACETFGLPGKEKQDLHLHEDDPSWSKYLRRDCLALAEVLEQAHDLIEHKLGGEVGMTAPSTSMKLYRRRFLGRGEAPSRVPRHAHYAGCLKGDNCTGCAHEWVRQAYYGGRTEVFRMSGENLHYYDINSSYVAAMREGMPAGDRRVETTYDPGMYEKNVGFVQCSVEIPETCDIPPLPYRSESGKLIFPVGRFSGVWSVEELRLLDDPLVNGKITSVTQAMWFRRKPLFVGMVDELWKLRDKSLEGYDEGLSALAKLMGNAQPVDEPVLTPSGWRPIGSLVVGDEVIGSSGNPTRVIGIHPQGVKPVFVFRCGHRSTRCCGDHLWRATPSTSRVPVVVRTAHIHETMDAGWTVPVLAFGDVKVTGITPDGEAECVCISVEADDRLYVTTSYLVTHNSLYGKFGMKQDRTQVVFTREHLVEGGCLLCKEEATENGQLCKDCEGSKPAQDDPDADVWYQKQHVDAPYIIPQIAAHITALARVRLWRFMKLVVERGGRIYYSDTDSVITDIAMPSSTELGAFKDEYPGVKLRGAFIQPKVYMLEADGGFPDKKKPPEKWETSKVTMKGFPREMRTKENLTALIKGVNLTKEQRRACSKDEHDWLELTNDGGRESRRCKVCGCLGFTRLEKVRTLARTGFHRGPQMVGVKKSFKSAYDKRVVHADGSTTPLVLNECGFDEEEPKSGVRVKVGNTNADVG